MKRKEVLFLLMFLLTNTCFSQKELKIEFQDEMSLAKYMVVQLGREEAKPLKKRLPYIHSATLNLTIDLKGKILQVDFVERAEEEDFNQLFERWVRSTSGKWKVTDAPGGVETLNIIIPFLQKTPPYAGYKDWTDLIEKFQNYHTSLSPDNIENCEASSCIIVHEIVNVMYPAVR
ncbi:MULTISPECIES: hypothetical protein [Roseivirga]|jgi:hypothetical protein|uniref:TonB C-terminal domain-containing protein n=1 Tax=Roseivirga spongicola TaxID=333140 RepID=A0A150XGM2_9BACT|nr:MULTISPECIES: hypothetical protein [Roseivirga]PWL29722.1 MAG: hypothetical protein DCO95_07710 [Roseivirga sp. XM-24bin3]KYG77852.1 hypothetical protein AWW68_03530 [Roseivirga spongicola]MBO6494177.1 hypothetical protein [Roseivirga sp.]MBO6661338.1 hypothetical protein [Roseivirga sp.]MBO6908678.1 hypothetical protein [Roseivirga sp.]